MEQGQVPFPGRGRPWHHPERVVGDKGYSYPAICRYLRAHSIRITIARRSDQHRGEAFTAPSIACATVSSG
jgi:hypothetical protein